MLYDAAITQNNNLKTLRIKLFHDTAGSTEKTPFMAVNYMEADTNAATFFQRRMSMRKLILKITPELFTDFMTTATVMRQVK